MKQLGEMSGAGNDTNAKSGINLLREPEMKEPERDALGVQGEARRRNAGRKQMSHKEKHRSRKTSQQKVSYRGQERGPGAWK